MDISDLLKLWRVEKASSQLAKLQSSFYQDARALTEGGNPYEAKKAADILKDVVNMRQHKMLMNCLRQLQGGDKPVNLLPSEKTAYGVIYNELDSMHLKGASVEVKEPEPVETIVEEESTEEVEETEQETLPEAEEKAEEVVEGTVEEQEAVEEPQEEVEEEPAEEKEKPVEEKEVEEVEDNVEKVEVKEEVQKETPEEEPQEEVEEKEEVEPPKEEQEEKKEEPKEVFKEKTENKALKRVKFMRPMPAFVGPDLQSLGPFEEDQVIELSEEIAEILLKNDAVELV